jgi:hypothetical protein
MWYRSQAAGAAADTIFVQCVEFLLIAYLVAETNDREAGRQVSDFVICIGPVSVCHCLRAVEFDPYIFPLCRPLVNVVG